MNQSAHQELASVSSVNAFRRTDIFTFRVIISVGNLMGKACGMCERQQNLMGKACGMCERQQNWWVRHAVGVSDNRI